MGCSPSKDLVAASRHHIVIPEAVSSERLLRYLVSGDFHNDLATQMTTDTQKGMWTMDLKDVIKDSWEGTTFTVYTKSLATDEVDSMLVYKVVDYSPSSRVVFSVTLTSETETIIHEQVSFHVEISESAVRKLILLTQAKLETGYITKMLHYFSPLEEHVQTRALVQLLSVKTACKRLETKRIKIAPPLEEDLPDRTNTPPPGPLLPHLPLLPPSPHPTHKTPPHHHQQPPHEQPPPPYHRHQPRTTAKRRSIPTLLEGEVGEGERENFESGFARARSLGRSGGGGGGGGGGGREDDSPREGLVGEGQGEKRD